MKMRALYIILLITSVTSFSCKDYMTVEPKGNSLQEQTFKSSENAISAIYGLYALMQPCVDQLFLAGDVQSDYVVAARGADANIAEIAQNRVSPQNPYTDYTNFYRLVSACNNAIAGLGDILRLDPVNYSPEMYNYNVAEIICIRAWAYLQLVKIWGDVPYIENTVTSADAITNIAPTSGDVILAKIEKEVADLASPSLQSAFPPSGMSYLYYTQFNNRSCQFLLSEINLYLGNYVRAYEIISPFAPYGFGTYTPQTYYHLLRCVGDNFILQFNFGQGNDWNYSIGFVIQFDGSKGQKNNLMHWTSNINGGIYAVKPSSFATKNWLSQPYLGTDPRWDYSGKPIPIGFGDPRGDGTSFFTVGGDTVISKYLCKARYTLKDPTMNDPETNDDVSFPVYRDGTAYLDVAECWNSMGRSSEALYPVNGFMATDTQLGGTRSRAQVGNVYYDPALGNIYGQMEQIILDERGLESAYEGHRWFDLVRFAKRNNNPALLADAVARKYPASQQLAIKGKLSNPNYWHWPYYYKNVAANKLLVQKPGY